MCGLGIFCCPRQIDVCFGRGAIDAHNERRATWHDTDRKFISNVEQREGKIVIVRHFHAFHYWDFELFLPPLVCNNHSWLFVFSFTFDLFGKNTLVIFGYFFLFSVISFYGIYQFWFFWYHSLATLTRDLDRIIKLKRNKYIFYAFLCVWQKAVFWMKKNISNDLSYFVICQRQTFNTSFASSSFAFLCTPLSRFDF